jgi:hypothetical protein
MTSRSSKSVHSSVVSPEEAHARVDALAAANTGRPLRLAAVRRKPVSGRAVSRKIARLLAGGRLRELDLFAGCGGLPLDFPAAGFELHAAVESDPDATRGYRWSFRVYASTVRPGMSAAEIAATLKSVAADATAA